MSEDRDEYEIDTGLAAMIFDGFSDENIIEYVQKLTKEIRAEFDAKLAPRTTS